MTVTSGYNLKSAIPQNGYLIINSQNDQWQINILLSYIEKSTQLKKLLKLYMYKPLLTLKERKTEIGKVKMSKNILPTKATISIAPMGSASAEKYKRVFDINI